MIHEDNRRTIYDWVNGDFKACKVLYIHEPISVGNHYHLKKDEHFFLVKGKFLEMQLGDSTLYDLEAPYIVNVWRGTYHRFICEPGSILVGVATAEYDIDDEIRGYANA